MMDIKIMLALFIPMIGIITCLSPDWVKPLLGALILIGFWAVLILVIGEDK